MTTPAWRPPTDEESRVAISGLIDIIEGAAVLVDFAPAIRAQIEHNDGKPTLCMFTSPMTKKMFRLELTEVYEYD